MQVSVSAPAGLEVQVPKEGGRRRSPRLASALIDSAANTSASASAPTLGLPGAPPLSSPLPAMQTDVWGSSNDDDGIEWEYQGDIPTSSSAGGSAGSASTSRATSLRRRNQAQAQAQAQAQTSHPLARDPTLPTPPAQYTDRLGDPSRPALQRATSQVERQVAESSRSASEVGGGSLRGSFDLLRMSQVDELTGGQAGAAEVEVFIHKIKPDESLAGIALLYGIDLPTLRKVNKLWASDPLHIRTHLYIPLEACRWNKASETLVRGPGEGQVTLSSKPARRGNPHPYSVVDVNGKGKEKQREGVSGENEFRNGHRPNPISSLTSAPLVGDTANLDLDEDAENGWGIDSETSSSFPSLNPAETFMPSTNIAYERQHRASQHGFPEETTDLLTNDAAHAAHAAHAVDDHVGEDERTPRILDIVRIPSSQLRFFPRPQKPPDADPSSSRASLDVLEADIDRDRDRYYHDVSEVKSSQNEIENAIRSNQAKYALRRSSSDSFPVGLNTSRQQGESTRSGPMIRNDLSTLPPSLTSRSSPPRPQHHGRSKTSNIVRLRPPSQVGAQPASGSGGIANRLSALFTIPPPPPSFASPSALRQPRISLDSNISNTTPRSSRGGSETGSPALKVKVKEKEESMELVPRGSAVGMGGAPDLGRIKARISRGKKED